MPSTHPSRTSAHPPNQGQPHAHNRTPHSLLPYCPRLRCIRSSRWSWSRGIEISSRRWGFWMYESWDCGIWYFSRVCMIGFVYLSDTISGCGNRTSTVVVANHWWSIAFDGWEISLQETGESFGWGGCNDWSRTFGAWFLSLFALTMVVMGLKWEFEYW